jgi:hypothetical protein
MFSPLTPVFSPLERLTETEKQWIRAAGRLHNPYPRACIVERCLCLHGVARPLPSGLSSGPVHEELSLFAQKVTAGEQCGIFEECFISQFFLCTYKIEKNRERNHFFAVFYLNIFGWVSL